MERSEISLHELKVFIALTDNPDRWFTNRDLAEHAKMPERTVRSHTLRFSKLGMIDLAELFPAHRYRYSAKADKRNASYFRRLTEARKVFGL